MGPSWALVGPQRPSTGKQARAGPAKPARALLCQTSEVLLGAAGPNAAGRARPARARPGQTRPGRARPGLGVAVARPRHAPPWTARGWPSPTGNEEGALKERRRVHGMTGTHTHTTRQETLDAPHTARHRRHTTHPTRPKTAPPMCTDLLSYAWCFARPSKPDPGTTRRRHCSLRRSLIRTDGALRKSTLRPSGVCPYPRASAS